MVKDPVCGMTINEEDAAGSITYRGGKYFFCAPGCKVSFIKNPKKYLIQYYLNKTEKSDHLKNNRKDKE
ncbi:MAG: YHS domain-containing protein [Ignavibacteriaceae bacterium]